jgi:putative ABC transport system permease protein
MWTLGLLRRRTSRIFLTVMGVALAVGLTTTMLSISAGLDTTSQRVLEGIGADLIVLDEGSRVISTNHLPFQNGTAIANDIESMGGGLTFDPIYSFPIYEKTVTLFPANFSQCAPQCQAVNPIANGEDPSRRHNLGGISFVEGNYLDEVVGDPFADTTEFRNHLYPEGYNSSAFTREIVLNRAVARELGASVGSTVHLAITRDFAQALPFTVIGIYEASFETGQSREVRLRLSELQYMDHRTHDEVTMIAVDVVDSRAAAAVGALVEQRYSGLQAATPEQVLSELDRTTQAFRVFASIVAFVAIGVAVLFAATIFMISARERVAEIAAMRAIGISRQTIFRQMLLESGVVGGLGLAVGLAVGAVGAWAIDFVLKTTTERVPAGMDVTALTPEVLILAGATSVLVGIAAGLVPALWATRLPIAAAIRNL